jgi:AcrR family transcriptional regulator
MSNDFQSDRYEGDAIRAPLQARSREKLDRIMTALESLLAEKPFDRITMTELAQRSGAGTSSIYARFSDKHALILGVHARLREQVFQCLEQLCNPSRWEGRSSDDVIANVMPVIVRFYFKHAPLLRAALFVDERMVRERQASVLRLAAEKFSALLTRCGGSAAADDAINGAVDAAGRVVASVMYSAIMFGDVQMVREAVSQRELTKQLVCVTTALVNEARLTGTPKRKAKAIIPLKRRAAALGGG